LLKEKQYYYKRKEITVNKELEQLKDKVGMLKDVPLLELVACTANLNSINLEPLANFS
jgi:hypothetical protein